MTKRTSRRRRKWTRPERPDYDRTVFEVLHSLAGKSAGEISRQTWVSSSTIRAWRRGYENGGTRHPQHSTLAAVAAVAGFEFRLVKKD